MNMPMEELKLYQDIIEKYNMGDSINLMLR